MNQSIDYNFQGTCEYKGVEYVLQMSVNAQEIVHRAKVNTTSNDPQILEYCSSFVAYAENKTLHEIEAGSFFNSKSKNLELDPLHYAWQRGLLDFLGDLALIKRKMKTEIQADSVVCNCSGLTEEELVRYKNGLIFTMDTLVKETRAGTGCGSCRADCKKIMETYNEYPSLTAKSYLRLWESIGVGKEEFLCRCKKVPPMEIAQLLEKSSEKRFETMHKDLQTRWGIGLSCTDCFDTIKAKLALL